MKTLRNIGKNTSILFSTVLLLSGATQSLFASNDHSAISRCSSIAVLAQNIINNRDAGISRSQTLKKLQVTNIPDSKTLTHFYVNHIYQQRNLQKQNLGAHIKASCTAQLEAIYANHKRGVL